MTVGGLHYCFPLMSVSGSSSLYVPVTGSWWHCCLTCPTAWRHYRCPCGPEHKTKAPTDGGWSIIQSGKFAPTSAGRENCFLSPMCMQMMTWFQDEDKYHEEQTETKQLWRIKTLQQAFCCCRTRGRQSASAFAGSIPCGKSNIYQKCKQNRKIVISQCD